MTYESFDAGITMPIDALVKASAVRLAAAVSYQVLHLVQRVTLCATFDLNGDGCRPGVLEQEYKLGAASLTCELWHAQADETVVRTHACTQQAWGHWLNVSKPWRATRL